MGGSGEEPKVSKELIFWRMEPEAPACSPEGFLEEGAAAAAAVGGSLGSGPRCRSPFRLWRNQAGLGATGGPFFTAPSGGPCCAPSSWAVGPWGLRGRLWVSLMTGLKRLRMQPEMRTQGSSAPSTSTCAWRCSPGGRTRAGAVTAEGTRWGRWGSCPVALRRPGFWGAGPQGRGGGGLLE